MVKIKSIIKRMEFRTKLVFEYLFHPINVDLDSIYGRWLRRYRGKYYQRLRGRLLVYQTKKLQKNSYDIKHIKFPLEEILFQCINLSDHLAIYLKKSCFIS